MSPPNQSTANSAVITSSWQIFVVRRSKEANPGKGDENEEARSESGGARRVRRGGKRGLQQRGFDGWRVEVGDAHVRWRRHALAALRLHGGRRLGLVRSDVQRDVRRDARGEV